jgi:hypothetical protein
MSADGPAVCDEQSALDLIGDAYGEQAFETAR